MKKYDNNHRVIYQKNDKGYEFWFKYKNNGDKLIKMKKPDGTEEYFKNTKNIEWKE